MNVDLSSEYLGLKLRNPLVVSSCPLTGNIDTLKELEQSGVAAAVLPSLFEEQIEHLESEISRLYDQGKECGPEALSYFPEMAEYNTGPDMYLLNLERAKSAVDIPIIASLNGTTTGGWTRFARLIEEAGADALELNIYSVPTDANVSPREIESGYVALMKSVRQAVSIPLAVKVGPYFSSIPSMAQCLEQAGANGLVLFNRYLEPDIDIDSMSIQPKLILSDRRELYLPLRWIAILKGQLSISLAATSGIQEGDDVIKALLVGADVAMAASVLLQRGPKHASRMLNQLRDWMQENGYTSVKQLKGSMSRANCLDPGALERANYTQALVSFSDKLSAHS